MSRLKTSILAVGEFAPKEMINLVQLTEALGYDIFWYADERFFREVYSGLTLASLNSQRIQLGTCVTDPYTRHPSLTAMAIATVDEISQGRAILGLGAGVSGFGSLGIKRDKPAVALRETIQLVRTLLSGQEADFHGQLFEFKGKLDWKPARANIPIYVATNGAQGLAVAGEFADGAIMHAAVADRTLEWMIENVRRGADRAGRDLSEIELVARVNVCVSNDSRAAKDAMRVGIARTLVATQPDFPSFRIAGLEVTSELRHTAQKTGYTHDNKLLAPVVELIPDEFVDAMTLAGSAEQVAHRLNRMVQHGISQIIVYPVSIEGGIERTIEAFASQVLPEVKA